MPKWHKEREMIKMTTMANDMKDEFEKAITPEVIDRPGDMFLFQCSKCKNVHFRHAGYVEMLMPFIRADKEKKVSKDSYSVHVCTKCKRCYVWYNEQMRDVTKLIDLKAWEKIEKELHLATGPGGQC